MSTAEKKPAKKKSAYTKRREALFGDSEDSGPIQRSKDMRTEQEKKEMLDWVCELHMCCFCHRFTELFVLGCGDVEGIH